jgi:ligand-binding sensor domain-containing protein
MLRQLFLSLFLLTLSGYLFAQKMYMRRINTEGEIPAHEIYNVFQDNSHYIWFASDAGVWRFDGKEYEGFTAAEGLPDNVVFGFFEDQRSRLWLKLFNNKVAFIENEKVVVLPCSDRLSRLKKQELVSSLYVDDHDTVYISYMRSDEIVKIAPPYKDDDLQFIRIASGTGHYIYETPSGEILAGSMASKAWADKSGDSVTLFLQNGTTVVPFKGKYIDSPRVLAVKQHDNSYLIGLGNVLFEYRDKRLKELVAFNNAILYAIYDNEHNLWVATVDAGLIFFKKDDKMYREPVTYFVKDFANCIIQDTENSYWIATLKNGLYYAPFNDVGLLNVNGIPGNISSTYFDKTDHKLYIFAPGSMTLLSGNVVEKVTDINFDPTETNDIYNAIAVDKENILCFGRQTFLFNKKSMHVQIIRPDNKNSQPGFFRSKGGVIKGDSVFCSGQSVLFLFDRSKNNLREYEKLNERINALCRLNDNTILIGTERRLIKYNFCTKEKATVDFLPEGISIIAIEYSPKWNGIMVILKSGRIYLADTSMNKLVRISNEINGVSVRKAYTDENGLVWLSTNKGIYTLDANLRLNVINKDHGLPANLINHISTGGNFVYASSESGLIIFPQAKSFLNQDPPDLYCTGVTINGEDRPLDSIYELNYSENFIKISYRALSYRINSKVQCKFILHGIDKDWQTTRNNTIEYTTLPPGQYDFELYVLNNDNVKSLGTIRFHFLIHPPYWKTGWFFFSLLSLSIITVIVLFRIRIRQVRKRGNEKSELTRKIAETKLLLLSSQMHPHFIFNSINSIQHYVLANEPLVANKYLTKFAKLMRNVLEQSRKEHVTLREELETIVLYLEMESLRFEDSFNYKIDVLPGLQLNKLLVPPLIIQPLIENAIWHGLLLKQGEKELIIAIYTDNSEYLFIEVDDNGIGRKASKQYAANKIKNESLGLKIIRERLSLLDNTSGVKTEITIIDKHFPNGTPDGTKVRLKIPLLKNGL